MLKVISEKEKKKGNKRKWNGKRKKNGNTKAKRALWIKNRHVGRAADVLVFGLK
jgi:hypothetical protein